MGSGSEGSVCRGRRGVHLFPGPGRGSAECAGCGCEGGPCPDHLPRLFGRAGEGGVAATDRLLATAAVRCRGAEEQADMHWNRRGGEGWTRRGGGWALLLANRTAKHIFWCQSRRKSIAFGKAPQRGERDNHSRAAEAGKLHQQSVP